MGALSIALSIEKYNLSLEALKWGSLAFLRILGFEISKLLSKKIVESLGFRSGKGEVSTKLGEGEGRKCVKMQVSLQKVLCLAKNKKNHIEFCPFFTPIFFPFLTLRVKFWPKNPKGGPLCLRIILSTRGLF